MKRLASLAPIVLSLFSGEARAQAIELQSMKTRLGHEVRLRAWSRADLEIDWKAASAIAVARDLSNRLLVPIVPTEGVRHGVEDGSLPAMTLEGRRLPVLAVLELVALKTGLRFVDHGRYLRLALPEEVKPDVSVRFYPVGELTFLIRDFVPPIGFDLRGSNHEMEEMEEPEARPVSGFDEAGLADLVKRFTPKELWERDDVSIESATGLLIVRQTPKAHREIESVLRELGGR